MDYFVAVIAITAGVGIANAITAGVTYLHKKNEGIVMDDIPLLRIIQITAILHETITDERIPKEVRNEYDSRVRDVLERKDYINDQHIK